jgi:hypothetical protein
MAGFTTVTATARPAPLIIREQGSFAVGGTVISNPGTFDPVSMAPEGQTFHGGDVTLVHLPDKGIHGNTHFPFSDLNNHDIAELMFKRLAEKGLD